MKMYDLMYNNLLVEFRHDQLMEMTEVMLLVALVLSALIPLFNILNLMIEKKKTIYELTKKLYRKALNSTHKTSDILVV